MVNAEGFDIQNGFELRFWLTYYAAGDALSLTSGDMNILSISVNTTSEIQIRVKG